MSVKLKESDAEQALALLRQLLGPDQIIHWEFQDACETIFFLVQNVELSQSEIDKNMGSIIRPVFDQLFPPQEDDYTWMVAFKNGEEVDRVLICGLNF